MAASPITTPAPTPGELVARAIAFGTLAIAGIAAIVIAGAWWAACIAAVGLLLAVAGLIDVFILLGDAAGQALASRRVALALGALAVAAYVVALVAA